MKKTLRIFLGISLALAACSSSVAVKPEESLPAFRPWGILGARITDTRDGVVISEVIREAAAYRVGLRVGDLIVSIGGTTGLRTEEIIDDIRGRLPGSVVRVHYTRRGAPSSVLVTVGEYPRDEQLYMMASAAAKSLDFDRAFALCQNFEKTVPQQSRYTAPMQELKASLLRKIGESGERSGR